ncbi:recombinase family protein [Rhodobaculum claviforme]|uniref:Resolvase n=1 Tax=Rhodobaculum claviforme TaxID=1549854 RepID=A0A934TKM2_9RHOB|nr:recombinase family protein [Rhodobaculum claviforme]MBK5927294.1 resolvase [Rhodobaculum claviforme]
MTRKGAIAARPPRVAIYARYSTELQREASIEDQLRVCRRRIEAEGWQEVRVHSDKGISGATHLRPGYQALLEDARTGRIDVVLAESLDRLSRDQEHVAGFYKLMVHAGVEVVTVAEGVISELHIGLKGTMSALYIKDLRQKTHRGLEGRVKAGKSAGGLSYGYAVVRTLLPDGTPSTGDFAVLPGEAAVVRRIFSDYAAGQSARRIAIALNAEGIPAPRSGKGTGTWTASTISGNWQRGTGILNNELYVGVRVWNRLSYGKDPITGKRGSRLNPPEEWISEPVPELRIIDDALWTAVKARQEATRMTVLVETQARPNGFGVARRPTYLFSGLLKCGCCGAGYTLMNKTKYGCSASRNRGTCDNRKLIKREELEARVLDGLRDRLMHPALVAEFLAEYQREWNRHQTDETAARATTKAELAQVTRKIDQILDAIEGGMFHPSMKDRMTALETQKTALNVKLEELGPEEPPVLLHPGLTEVYARKVGDLVTALNAEGTRLEATEILRSLVDEIRLHPEQDGHAIEIVGDLAGILSLCEGDTTKPRALRLGVSDSVVAGVGFEPTTFRL